MRYLLALQWGRRPHFVHVPNTLTEPRYRVPKLLQIRCIFSNLRHMHDGAYHHLVSSSCPLFSPAPSHHLHPTILPSSPPRPPFFRNVPQLIHQLRRYNFIFPPAQYRCRGKYPPEPGRRGAEERERANDGPVPDRIRDGGEGVGGDEGGDLGVSLVSAVFVGGGMGMDRPWNSSE